jgi:branched-chain amino acid aminotransferase
MKSDFIWMDGELLPYDQATVHFFTPTLHYGVGVFEGIRCYNTPNGAAVFRLRDHMTRFIESIHILGVRDFPYTVEDLCKAVFQTICANHFQECYIRPLMYLKGPMGMNMDLSRPAVGIAVWEWGPYLGKESMESGIHMMVSSFTRLHPNIAMTKAKISGNYVNSLMVKTLALRSGYDEAVILDPQGFVAECTGENIFMIRKGVLYTPDLDNVLEGVTRNTVLTLAADLGIPARESNISRDQLYIAEEVFITGTAAELVGVRMIDFRKVGGGSVGPLTRTISQAYSAAVHGEGIHSTEWLDYVTQGD